MTGSAEAGASARLLSIEDAEKELVALAAREQELELELEKLYSRAAHLCQSESRNLAHASENHKQVPTAIRKLQETLQQTSSVADELSGRVRKLDVVCGRVGDCLKLVDDMLELRECSDQVNKAIQTEDFERAVKCVARYRAAQDDLPPGTDDASIRVLREAEIQLSALVRQRFSAAMSAKDAANVTRFAKFFHPLGLTGEGVQKYAEFIRKTLAENCQEQFRALAPSFGKKDLENPPYAEALMSVFLGIADIIEDHQHAVEDEFGPENFIVVLRSLLEEADIQGLKVVEKFCKDNAKIFEQQGACDTRDVGSVLQETALITQRTQQFDAYIHNMAKEVVEKIADKSDFLKALPKNHSEADGLPEITRLLHRVQELVSTYVQVEDAFLLRLVGQAVKESDSLDPYDVDKKTTTIVDDAFFILHESMQRAIGTCDINAACAVVNNVSACISNEMKDALMSNLAESKRSYSSWVTHARNFAPPEGDNHPLMALFVDFEGKMRHPLTSACSWPHSLNNIQQSFENMSALKESAERLFEEMFPEDGVDKDKRVMFQHCLGQFDNAKTELENLHAAKCKEGLQMLKVQLSPMLQPLDNIDYEIDESTYADFQVNDPFARAFTAQADAIYQHLKLVLNPASCEEITQNMAEQTCRRLEREALQKRFSLFGALQFETDVRALCSFFTSVSEQALRHKFARLFEMAGLLSLESASELRDLSGEMRRLTSEEVRKLIAARVDFHATDADLEGLVLGT